jgi:hypothetical protein
MYSLAQYQTRRPKRRCRSPLTHPSPPSPLSQHLAGVYEGPRNVFFLVDRSVNGGATSTNHAAGPVYIRDPGLQRLATEVAVPIVLQIAGQQPAPQPLPISMAEAIYLHATLAASGPFPDLVRRNPRGAFRDFEQVARGGFSAAWFKLGRDYENFNNRAHAKDCFERGAKLGVESCVYVRVCSFLFFFLIFFIAYGYGPSHGPTQPTRQPTSSRTPPPPRRHACLVRGAPASLRLRPPPLRILPCLHPPSTLLTLHPRRLLPRTRSASIPGTRSLPQLFPRAI